MSQLFSLYLIMIFVFLNCFSLVSQSKFDGFENIQNDVIVKELKEFCYKSKNFKTENDIVEILPSYCNQSTVNFNYRSTYISIHTKDIERGGNSKILTDLRVVVHSNYKIKIDSSDISDVTGLIFYSRRNDKINQGYWCKLLKLFGNNLCRQKYATSPYYKLFYSKDKRRFYIYLLLVQDSENEMVWIFKDDKYFGRIVVDINKY